MRQALDVEAISEEMNSDDSAAVPNVSREPNRLDVV